MNVNPSHELNRLLTSSTYGKKYTHCICTKCGGETWDVYQTPGKPTMCTFCQASEMEIHHMGTDYPDTIKVLIALYEAWIDQWTSYNNNVRDGVALLNEAETLGWKLEYVRTKWTEDLQEIPGHVIAREI